MSHFGKRMIVRAAMAAMVLVGLAAFSARPAGAAPATATGTANATIVAASAITAVQTLEFGYIVPDTAAQSTIWVSSLGVRTVASGAAILVAGGIVRQGTFSITGTTGYAVTVSGSVSSLSGPGPAMALNVFDFTPASPFTLSASPTILNVGAHLVVGTAALQMVGNYTGTYTVTLNYQ